MLAAMDARMETEHEAGVHDGAGVPDEPGVADGFERLWMPHRLAYIKGENKPDSAEAGNGCPFCRVPTLGDAEGLIVERGKFVYAVLNLYPYNPGHLLICPYRHVADYTDLTLEETAELAAFTKSGMVAIRAAASPHGFNLGMNQGTVSGAGIAAHLHQHIVPRWGGDANFMSVVGHTRVLPQLLADTRELLAQHWPADDSDQANGAVS
jgi:ATP adenylyltransferase